MKRNFDIHAVWRIVRRYGRWILAVVILLVAVRIALPFAVKDYVNRRLDDAKNYAGKIGDVHMRLWHGGYRIEHGEILKKSGRIKTPLFAAGEADRQIAWGDLIHAADGGEVGLWQPRG